MKKRNSPKVVAVLGGMIILIGCLSFIIAEGDDLTASISNPRMVLYGNYTGEDITIRNFVGVRNDNSYDIKISLKAIEDLEGKVSFDEEEFILVPGEDKDVYYTINLDDAGVYEGGIRILFSVEKDNRELSLIQEVDVLVKENEKRFALSPWLINLSLLVVVLIALGVYWRLRK